jgi:dTDP-glucose 4,6-dehydratase
LGWTRRHTFEQGLKDTIDWYKANAAWVAAIQTNEYLSYYEKQYGRL